jgi:Flp pilus assembly protein TadG
VIRSCDQRGQAAVLAIGLALVTFMVAGLAVDGTRAFIYRRTLQNAADGAALAAASEIDKNRYYSSGGKRVILDGRAARETAIRLLSRRGLDVRASVVAGSDSVELVVRGEIPTMFLALAGIREVPVAVAARAEPFAGEL